MKNANEENIINKVFEEAERIGCLISEKYSEEIKNNTKMYFCEICSGNIQSVGEGMTKLEAKKDACFKMYPQLVKMNKCRSIKLYKSKPNRRGGI